MNANTRREFQLRGYASARELLERLQALGFKPGSLAKPDVDLWVDGVAAWLTGFVCGMGLRPDAASAAIARSVTPLGRFYTSFLTNSGRVGPPEA